MALELEDEHELSERVKAWLRENGGTLLGGVALGIALIFGWNWWQDARLEHRLTAATQFGALEAAVERKDLDAARDLARSLAADFGDTGYALLAQLRLADLELLRGENEAARETLLAARALIGKDPAAVALVATRLARVEIALGQAGSALERLDGIDPAFAGIAAQLRGDALARLERTQEAREAYREALTLLDSGSPQREFVERKLAELAPAPEA